MVISEEQAGFRAGRSTVHQILTLRLIAEKFREVDQTVYNCFVDLKKAFASVWHEGLWAVLKLYAIDDKLIKLIQAIYNQAQSTVQINGKQSEWFRMTVGNRQGDPISPRAFIIVLERIMDGVKALQEERGVNIHGMPINNLKFADDVDLLDSMLNGLQTLLNQIYQDSERFGLHINSDKTKVMAFTRRNDDNTGDTRLAGDNREC
jgi:hypothetical protein